MGKTNSQNNNQQKHTKNTYPQNKQNKQQHKHKQTFNNKKCKTKANFKTQRKVNRSKQQAAKNEGLNTYPKKQTTQATTHKQTKQHK